MSRLFATAFQSLNKSLIQETRLKTLGLYKSLLQSCRHYPFGQLLRNEIQTKFKKHKYVTSRTNVFKLLTEAEKVLIYFILIVF
ncbi:MAG: hypothetical protein EXX96DRAFT_472551 [Benjaminiella poitrasii]|nr:MAG: hypothetical protein EXX96DRAFT_472551 [Benjaminiella poitrasii]